MVIVDANIILRYLLQDHKELSLKSGELIENNLVFLLDMILAEVVYVLEKVYKISKQDIQYSLILFINQETIFAENKNLLSYALKLYNEKNIDFVDAMLLSYKKLLKRDILTFDKKLEKLLHEKDKIFR